MTLYIGVDGGGTKTEVFGFHLEERKGAFGAGPASNPNTVGWDTAVETVKELMLSMIRKFGSSVSEIGGISLCMAGVDGPEQVEIVREYFSSALPHASLEVANDALAALTAGTRGASGTVLIAGTGSIAVGEGADGKVVRSGGFGNLIGDEGSGFCIGRAGIMAAIQSREGRGPKTALWDHVMQVYGITQPGEIIPKIYDSPHPVGAVASFAKHVVAEAPVDPVAQRIIEEAVSDHVRLIGSVRAQLGDSVSDQVILAGGLFTNTSLLVDHIRKRLPNLRCVPLVERPCAGAALRAVVRAQGHPQQSNPTNESLLNAWEDAVRRAEWIEEIH